MNLTKYRNTLLSKAVNDLKNDVDVLGIYLAGSLASGDFDDYSDIDLHTIVNRENLSKFIEQKYSRAQNWGNVLFFENLNMNVPYAVVHYDNFVKIDSWYHCIEDLSPSIWLKNCKILYDKTERLSEVINISNTIEYKITAQEVEYWRVKYLAYAHEAYRNAKRNEFYAALEMLNMARWLIAYGWYAERGIHINAGWGMWSKLEGERSLLTQNQKEMLADWFCGRDTNQIIFTISKLTPEFLRLNTRLSEIVGINNQSEMCKTALRMD
ncbi:MAG: nucleotidyltransferase domain-containing protein [Oscillospiraceae bacterium]|nr:nucleotidyltransferase domain-containing protein [Oscillospiraceae bacterium]